MAFDKWIKKKKVTKVIDATVGGGPSAILENPVMDGVEREVPLTSLSTLMEDIAALADENLSLAREVSQEILQENLQEPLVVDYDALIKRTLWSPEDVFLYPDQPIPSSLSNELAAIEREIVKKVKDPRAPFLNDLAHMGLESSQIGYVIKNYWQRITNPNQLYDKPRESNLFRYNLEKNRQALQVIRQQIYRVRDNRFQKMGLVIAYALGTRILTEFKKSSANQIRNEITRILRILHGLRTLVNYGLILQTTNWESIGKLLFEAAEGELSAMIQRMVSSQCYAITEGIQDKLFDFTDSLAGDMGDVFGLIDTNNLFPEIMEFNALVENVLFDNMKKVEEHMLFNESRMLQLEDSRRKQIETSQKASKVKQLRDMLTSIIAYVESLQAVENIVDAEYLTELHRIISNFWGENGLNELKAMGNVKDA